MKPIIKIPELNIEVETEFHQKDVGVNDIKVPEGWRLLTLNEWLICLNKHSDKFKDLNFKADEFVQQPIDKIKKDFPFCNVWLNSCDGGSDLNCGMWDFDWDHKVFGVRFCRDY